jgi:hypothetical protein
MMGNANQHADKNCAEPRRRLRWYQFSLRTLLIAVTLIACACSWFTVQIQRADQQYDAAEILSHFGYSVEYDYEYPREWGQTKSPPAPEWILNLVGEDFIYNVHAVGEYPNYSFIRPPNETHPPVMTDADMEVFQHLPRLRILRLQNNLGDSAQLTDDGIFNLESLKLLETLDLSGTAITDAGLAHIEGLEELRTLRLADTKITDLGLGHLTGLGRLCSIDLSRTAITDAGVIQLQHMPQLHELFLSNTRITDDGVEHLKCLKDLEVLCVDHAAVTDAGLTHVRELKKLKRISLYDTKITPSGVEELQRAFPELKIER